MKRLLAAILLLVSFTANAHITEVPACYDWKNSAVTYAPAPWQILAENDTGTAMATTLRHRPIILYDYEEVNGFDKLTQFIVFAHECAHHELKHLVNGVEFPMIMSREAMELQADCRSSNRTRETGRWTFDEVEAALKKLFWSHDDMHGSFETRLAKYKACWVTDIKW